MCRGVLSGNCYLSEGAIAKGSIREVKARRVGKVKEFSAICNFIFSRIVELLADGKVGIVNSIATKWKISRGVPGHLIARISETSGIENGRGIRIDIVAEQDHVRWQRPGDS